MQSGDESDGMGVWPSRWASTQKNRDSTAGQHPHPTPSKNCYNIVRWYDGDDDDNGDDDGDHDDDDGDISIYFCLFNDYRS